MFQEMLALSNNGGGSAKVASGTIATAGTITINCGFRPTKVYIFSRNAYTREAVYDEELNLNLSAYRTSAYVEGTSYITINDTGFTATITADSYWVNTVWIATTDSTD